MGNQRLNRLLAELKDELGKGDALDDETRVLLGRLNDDIERLTGETESPTDLARELESRFAAEYPVAERLAREIADALAKMGI